MNELLNWGYIYNDTRKDKYGFKINDDSILNAFYYEIYYKLWKNEKPRVKNKTRKRKPTHNCS